MDRKNNQHTKKIRFAITTIGMRKGSQCVKKLLKSRAEVAQLTFLFCFSFLPLTIESTKIIMIKTKGFKLSLILKLTS